MNKEMIELYTDYQISSFGQVTGTGLSAMLDNAISHDKVTSFLGKEEMTSKELWKLVKPVVRDIENDKGVLIFDDTIQEKKHTEESETNCWHYDHTVNRNVKGINILNCMYYYKDVSIPLSFEIITKPIKYCDVKTKKEKRHSERTKNQMLRDMVDTVCQNQVKFRYVLMDSWFTSIETLKYIHKKKKFVISALKSNRLIALTEADKQAQNFININTAELPDKQAVTGYLKGYPHKVVFLRQVFTNKDGSEGVLYLVCTDVECDGNDIVENYKKRWSIEVFHKSLKQNANLAKSQARKKITQHNHIFLSIYAVFKLECLKIKTKLNHFALRAKLLVTASKAAFQQLSNLSSA